MMEIVCNICGAVNDQYAPMCWNCGYVFTQEDDMIPTRASFVYDDEELEQKLEDYRENCGE